MARRAGAQLLPVAREWSSLRRALAWVADDLDLVEDLAAARYRSHVHDADAGVGRDGNHPTDGSSSMAPRPSSLHLDRLGSIASWPERTPTSRSGPRSKGASSGLSLKRAIDPTVG